MYIPKNRIKTNLYTSGNEFIVKADKTNYIGYYHSLWTGKFFTGKTQNEKPKLEIIKQSAEMDSSWVRTNEELKFQQYAENFDGEVVPGQFQKMEDVINYNLITKTDISIAKLIPQQYYPKPTEDDYALGVFTRYFCVKINELQYLELSKEVYNKLKEKSKKYTCELYKIFKLQWTLTGDKNSVSITNRNQTLIAQQRTKRIGLSGFLNENWTKFYKSNVDTD
tara:strand:+ start:147 stop:815 length:669 start_codon:yes stop_codon:yes gene_type:complete